MTPRLSRLRELNEKRTKDYPWKYDEHGQMVWSIDTKEQYSAHICDIRGFGENLPIEINGQFISLSANMMSELLAVVEAAKGVIHREQIGGYGHEGFDELKQALSRLESSDEQG